MSFLCTEEKDQAHRMEVPTTTHARTQDVHPPPAEHHDPAGGCDRGCERGGRCQGSDLRDRGAASGAHSTVYLSTFQANTTLYTAELLTLAAVRFRPRCKAVPRAPTQANMSGVFVHILFSVPGPRITLLQEQRRGEAAQPVPPNDQVSLSSHGTRIQATPDRKPARSSVSHVALTVYPVWSPVCPQPSSAFPPKGCLLHGLKGSSWCILNANNLATKDGKYLL
ncbi:hypothetical protein H920_02717 [Fukomys damarensis]|uniref:Uncharacterized protein n=1 Tax=Fukomys damarensis TaxID=885580 RepID=A0A091DZY2_FUKDA|nr:hypothetical protein H920_02717 [Fukomys damarensis]